MKLILNKNNKNNLNSNSLIKLESKNMSNISPIKKIHLSIQESKKFDKNDDFYDYDLNTMVYKDALKYDKRKLIQYYISLLKIKNYILFAFFPNKDYNSTIIKISLFLIFFSIFYFINALFFDEPTIHKIYKDEGFYNFNFLVKHIFCSFAIAHTINTVLKFVFLSERNIFEIKIKKNSYDVSEKNEKRIVIKYICLYSIGLAFLIFFWYYLSSFGAVYQNTQVYLIKNTSISFAVALVYPFLINIFVAMLRIFALKGKNNECLYKISRYCQYI